MFVILCPDSSPESCVAPALPFWDGREREGAGEQVLPTLLSLAHFDEVPRYEPLTKTNHSSNSHLKVLKFMGKCPHS